MRRNHYFADTEKVVLVDNSLRSTEEGELYEIGELELLLAIDYHTFPDEQVLGIELIGSQKTHGHASCDNDLYFGISKGKDPEYRKRFLEEVREVDPDIPDDVPIAFWHSDVMQTAQSITVPIKRDIREKGKPWTSVVNKDPVLNLHYWTQDNNSFWSWKHFRLDYRNPSELELEFVRKYSMVAGEIKDHCKECRMRQDNLQ
jgi:hypothetical protein